jgi:branched-chain amino acid transport system ATP-binding protein
MLEIKDLHTYYGNIHALKGVSLTIQGLLRPRQGTILFEGKPLESLSTEAIVRLGISQSPEGRLIFPRMTVQENLEMGAYLRNDTLGIKSDMEKALNLFPRLRERISQKGGTLSGGEQQMLAIGRALMSRPRLLLLDEPSMGLAPMLVSQIFAIIRDINAQGTTILLVEQNARMALSVAHRGYVIQTGQVVVAGSATDLQSNETVRQAYLGES